MNQLKLWLAIVLSASVVGGVRSVEALPGERTETVSAWINANATLQPGAGEGLRVRRRDTAARRFEFEASVIPPGRISLPTNPGLIRSEQFAIYDQIDGVPLQRLEESLRAIYGVDIYQDYQQARVVYRYPSPETLELARRQNRPAWVAQHGELRTGKRFAYWFEVTHRRDGMPLNGQMTVFLKEDLEKLETELRDR
ncbi:hypothetical protein IQ249_08245 [Lusitaniella coriacea LEGE 07157]|uniref:Uncharacterized protein n=1 Tax=Lusitaniella coriacea LEGE 07157 TaxID=945747 RepID=A0A8J7DVL5_9CYAN|nr:hypothetical protein [Lusitaniella coriacea]MBE9115880.1 hypothetical protein [Lusitaniella coriacea LEGE 07157]